MQIKELAGKLKISPRAVRFYEDKGLIQPRKQAHNGYREFDEQDVWRLQTVISLREAGMTVADIKRVLENMDNADTSELQDYLELQRSVLFAKWLELKQVIETTDEMINVVKNNQSLPLDDIYRLAEGSRRLREQRNSWSDQWNYDRLAPFHDQKVQADNGNYKDYGTALRRTVERISPAKREKGLDVGAGTGNLAGLLSAGGAVMSAVDQSKEMLKICRSKFPQIETKRGNFLALPFMDGTFDFAVSSFALRHLTADQLPLAVQELQRVLKPGGRICLTDLMIEEKPAETCGHAPACDRAPAYGHDPACSDASACAHAPDSLLSRLRHQFEQLGFRVQVETVNERLHIVYAA